MTKLLHLRACPGLMGGTRPRGGERYAGRGLPTDAARSAASATQADHPAATQGEEPAEALLPVDAWLMARLDQTTARQPTCWTPMKPAPRPPDRRAFSGRTSATKLYRDRQGGSISR